MPQAATFALRFRNYEELQQRIARGEVLTVEELQDRYLPTPEVWGRVARWAEARGLSVDAMDSARMAVFAHASVVAAAQAFHTQFARVIGTDGREYTSAIQDPTIDDSIAGDVISVQDLQPHLRPVRPQETQNITPIVYGTPSKGYYLSPQTIAEFYHAWDLGYTGAGQTIVILGLDAVNTADLTAFWSKIGASTTLAQYREVDLSTPSTNSSAEETKDIEWSSAMAPAADIIYLVNLTPSAFSSWIINNLKSYPSIHQVSGSWLLNYDLTASTSITSQSQYFAALTAVGVTTFFSSGDYGSNGITPFPSYNSGYVPGGAQCPAYPASDPYVTAVGGTTVHCQSGPNGYPISPITEGAWCLPTITPPALPGEPVYYGYYCSAGGLSANFARPSWQVGAGLPAGTQRAVPDVAAMANSDTPGYAYFDGADTAFTGTSQACPIWAGLCADINPVASHSWSGERVSI